MGNCFSYFSRRDQLTNYSRLQQLPDDYCDGRRNSHTLPWTDRGAVGVHNSSRIISQHVHYTAKDQEIQKLMRQIKEKEEQYQTLTSKTDQLERGVESLRSELEAERLSKERELRKMTTKREKEVAEHKKQLASMKQKLVAEQKSLSAEKEQCSSQSPETLLSLRHFSSVVPALSKNHKTYFRGFFLLRTPLHISGHPAEIGPNDQGWLTLRCPTTSMAVTFNDLCTEVSVAVNKCSGLHISNYWCDDVPIFQLDITSTDSLKKILHSENQLQKQLTTSLSQMFNKDTQVQLGLEIFLVLPSASDRDGEIVQVTLDNAEECMAQWERRAAFTLQAIGNDHRWRAAAEPTLGSDNLGEILKQLDGVIALWLPLGVQLNVPYSDLQVISCNHRGDARRCMMEMIQSWLNNTLDPKWSTIVQALAKIGHKRLAHKIALNYGIANAGIAEMNSVHVAVGENLMEHPTETQKKLMESVDELRKNIKSIQLKLRKQEQVLNEAEQNGVGVQNRLINTKEKMSSCNSRTEELTEQEIELEKTLKFREVEIEILKDSARKERAYLIALREEEFAMYQKELDSVKQELEEKRKEIPGLKEEVQRLLLELAKKSEEIRHLRSAREETNSQLRIERERVEMKANELTAAAVSHAVHMKEVQMQLAVLEENKKQSMKTICSLRDAVQKKEVEIGVLSQQITTREQQEKDQMSKELADMKMNMMQLQNEVDRLRTEVTLCQKEASYYHDHATALLAATPCTPDKLSLKWKNQKKAPKAMWRGAAIVHGAIIYIIEHGSHTLYSFQLDGDKWNKHSECPHINPGLVIINDLLTAVGGKEGDHPTNRLVSWNHTREWVRLFPPMQTARERPAVVYNGTYVIALGGDLEERGVELLHIPSLLWSTATSLPKPLKNITTTLCHDGTVAMDCYGSAYMIKIDSLISSIRLEKSSTQHSLWLPLPQCPVHCYAGYSGGPVLTTFRGQVLVVSYSGIFQLHVQERQWVRIGDMSVPMYDCMVCTVCDHMVVVGGLSPDFTPTDAVHVAISV